jgi:hypothetical protein
VLDEPSQQSAGIAELRGALDAYDDPRPEGEPFTLAAIESRLDAVSGRVLALCNTDVLSELPNLLHHLYVLADWPGHAGELARAALHDAYRMSATAAGRSTRHGRGTSRQRPTRDHGDQQPGRRAAAGFTDHALMPHTDGADRHRPLHLMMLVCARPGRGAQCMAADSPGGGPVILRRFPSSCRNHRPPATHHGDRGSFVAISRQNNRSTSWHV